MAANDDTVEEASGGAGPACGRAHARRIQPSDQSRDGSQLSTDHCTVTMGKREDEAGSWARTNCRACSGTRRPGMPPSNASRERGRQKAWCSMTANGGRGGRPTRWWHWRAECNHLQAVLPRGPTPMSAASVRRRRERDRMLGERPDIMGTRSGLEATTEYLQPGRVGSSPLPATPLFESGALLWRCREEEGGGRVLGF